MKKLREVSVRVLLRSSRYHSIGGTSPHMRTLIHMVPDKALVKRHHLGGREVRPNAKQKAKLPRCHRSNNVNVLLPGRDAVNGEFIHI